MRVEEARERIRSDTGHTFISLTDEVGPGPVVAVKDVIDVRGCVTTAGGLPSAHGPRADGARPADPGTGFALDDAVVVQTVRAAGCRVVGKSNLHEFCLGPTSENPHHGSVANPRDRARMAGGSSGGSAAAVAAGLCDWALGTDTSGSVRIPAALCGVVGIKPSTGLVASTGTVPLSRTQDTIGPLAPDVPTAAHALQLMTGLPIAEASQGRRGGPLRLGVPGGWDDGLSADVRSVWDELAQDLPRVSVPDLAGVCSTGSVIVMAEAAAVHRERLGHDPQLYGSDVRDLLTRASRVARQDYVTALMAAARTKVALEEALRGFDALLLPTTRITAPLLGSDVRWADLTDLTRPFSVTGHPVVTLPAPTTGLPVGIQVVGRLGDDAGTVAVAAALEREWQ